MRIAESVWNSPGFTRKWRRPGSRAWISANIRCASSRSPEANVTTIASGSLPSSRKMSCFRADLNEIRSPWQPRRCAVSRPASRCSEPKPDEDFSADHSLKPARRRPCRSAKDPPPGVARPFHPPLESPGAPAFRPGNPDAGTRPEPWFRLRRSRAVRIHFLARCVFSRMDGSVALGFHAREIGLVLVGQALAFGCFGVETLLLQRQPQLMDAFAFVIVGSRVLGAAPSFLRLGEVVRGNVVLGKRRPIIDIAANDFAEAQK